MNAPSVWAIIVLGVANVALVADRWHMVNRVTELADRIAAAHGDRVRVVAPPKPTAVPAVPVEVSASADGRKAGATP